LEQVDEETARECLKEFLENQFQGSIVLQMFSMNPPEYRIEIKLLSEFQGIDLPDSEDPARIQAM
jgi:hypothetical protein